MTSTASFEAGALDLSAVISPEQIRAAHHCGRGGFADVFHIEHPSLGKIALKRLKESHDKTTAQDQRRRALREAQIWKAAAHPNILTCTGIIDTADYFYFVSPYAEKGSLMRFVLLNPNAHRIRLLAESAAGIAFLHSNGIVHGDIKAANVLVSDDVHALICDFGLTKSSETVTSSAVAGGGTWRWMSPELIRKGGGKKYASDVWAFGILIYEILSGLVPFADMTDMAFVKVMLAKTLRPPTKPSASSTGLPYTVTWNVATDCWRKEPQRRPSMEDCHQRLRAEGEIESALGTEVSGQPNRHALTLATGDTTRVAGFTLRRLLSAGIGIFRRSPLATQAPSDPSTAIFATDSMDGPSAEYAMASLSDVFRCMTGPMCLVWQIAFSSDSRKLASALVDCTIRLWDVAEAIPLGKSLEGHTKEVNSVAFSPDGTTLVSGSSDCTLRLWDVSTGRTTGEPLTGHTDWVSSVTFSPDGRTIASSSGDKTIRIWDSVSRSCIAVLEGHAELVRSVAFSPDGKTLVSGSADGTVRRWDMATNAQIGEPMNGHTEWVRSVAVSSDGSTVASGSIDKTIRLWDVRSGELKVPPLEGHAYYVYSVAFHPNGRLLASGSMGTTIRIWDLTTTPPTTKLGLKDHASHVFSVAFSPDGKWLASGSHDNTVRLWDLEVLIGTV